MFDCVKHFCCVSCVFIFRHSLMVSSDWNPSEQPTRWGGLSSRHHALSAGVRLGTATLGYRRRQNIWHGFFCFDSPLFSQLSRRDTPTRCSVSRRGCFAFCAALAWERPNSNLQKHTAVRCQGWSSSCDPGLRIEKPRSALWCAGASALWGVMPPAFLFFFFGFLSVHSSPVSPADISQESA